MMEKEILNWSKARLWSPRHNCTEEEKLEEECAGWECEWKKRRQRN
jgi:hypothetical protein